MLSRIAQRNANRSFLHAAPRVTAQATGSRFLSIHTQLAKKEKVEEDRFIRELDHQNYLARKAEDEEKVARAEMSAAEEVAKARMDAAVGEVFGILSQTGEKLSDTAVENFAVWKLGK